jgi:hypothetical protein
MFPSIDKAVQGAADFVFGDPTKSSAAVEKKFQEALKKDKMRRAAKAEALKKVVKDPSTAVIAAKAATAAAAKVEASTKKSDPRDSEAMLTRALTTAINNSKERDIVLKLDGKEMARIVEKHINRNHQI